MPLYGIVNTISLRAFMVSQNIHDVPEGGSHSVEQTRPWGRIMWQFTKNVPIVLRVAWNEARKNVLGEETDAVICPFVPRDQRKLKKVLDGRQRAEAYCSTASTEAPVL